MALVANRRSVMTLFSKSVCAQSHRTRIVLAEKGINADLIDVEGPDLPEDLLDLNPYHSLPTLVDRELVLYDARVIMEYLDERFPHPPLMPVDPVSRAQFRLALFRIEKDWYQLVDKIESSGDTKSANVARKQLKESLLSSTEIFATKPFFISDDFSLVDCTVAPILWRLPHFGIELPGNVKPIQQYMERVFSRPSFQASLTELEQEMRM
ncbi:MAG: glutathione S-transferase N-terminal domain-containing protein [Gammaproteobacteria bacterium]|nr:glutathione S-transferase N-terminal domain-containing protein [Gammaproteobacteria bacterium]